MRRTAYGIARTGLAFLRDTHLQAANDPVCGPAQRRIVAWTWALCIVLAAALLWKGQFA